MKRLLLTYLVVMLGLSGLLGAANAQDDSAESNRQRWEAMSEEERAKIIQTYRRWKNLDESRRAIVRRRFQQFRSLPDEEKLNIAINMRRFREMPPGKRQMIRRHLCVPPERRMRQLALMRVVSLARENAGDKPRPERIRREFRKMEYRILREVFYPTLSEKQKRRVDVLQKQEDKYRLLRRLALQKVERELEKNPPPDLPDKGTPAYRRALCKRAVRRYYTRVVQELPPSMAEMALFVRAGARNHLPREEVMDAVNALKKGIPRQEAQEKLQALMTTDEMKRLVNTMPEKMRRRYLSDEFGEEKRRQVVIMAFKPLNELRPPARRMYFNRRCRRIHKPPRPNP